MTTHIEGNHFTEGPSRYAIQLEGRREPTWRHFFLHLLAYQAVGWTLGAVIGWIWMSCR